MSAQQFDFWLGRWRGTWEGGSAVNEVSFAYDARVVLERFTADAPETFAGMSVSVYDAAASLWRQTWVDNAGNYLDFTGGLVDDEMRLSRHAVVEGADLQKRMVWTDIADDRFEWYWLRSPDGSEWEPLWHISYERLE